MRKHVGIFLIACMITTSMKAPIAVAETSNGQKMTSVLRTVVHLMEQAKDVVDEWPGKIKKKMEDGIDKSKEHANALTAMALALSVDVRSSASYQKAMEVIQNPGAFSSAYGHLSRFRRNLDWSDIDPTKYLYAGTRGVSRGMVEAKKVWETIPSSIRASGPEALARYLKGKDWSHIQPYSMGGSHDALNGIFEDKSLNRARGDNRMTPEELKAAQSVLRSDAFRATLLESTKNAIKGGAAAAAFMAVVAVLEYRLEYLNGEITEEEMYAGIGKTIAAAGISGAAVSGLITAMALTFPALIPVLAKISIPLIIVGFSMMGIKIVTLGKELYEVYQGS